MRPLTPPPACLFFTAILARGYAAFEEAVNSLVELYGNPVEFLPKEKFDHSDYYKKEMGSGLLKGFLGFQPPFNPADLALRKRQTRELEWKFGIHEFNGFRRVVNIDPGYVSLSQTVLATSKNFSYRIYLEDGIFAEVTLLYHATGWELLQWTYPDYKIPGVQNFLTCCRSKLKTYIDFQHR
ncbi:DUF4416 family protein [bacterium]|nr:DUF4416 family protein [bacterium]